MTNFAKKFLNYSKSDKKNLSPLQKREVFRGVITCVQGLIFIIMCHIPYLSMVKHGGDIGMFFVYIIPTLFLIPMCIFVDSGYISKYRSHDFEINDKFKKIISIFGALIIAYLFYLPYNAMTIHNYTTPAGWANFGIVYAIASVFTIMYSIMLYYFYIIDTDRRY